MSSTRSRRRVRGTLFVGTTSALERADALIAAHAAQRPVRTITARRGARAWRRSLDDVAAVVLLANPDIPVAEAIEGTHLLADSRPVPIGVLPDTPRAIAAAAEVQRRSAAGSRLGAGPVALLSSREDHIRSRADALAMILDGGAASFRHLPSGRLDRRQLLRALARGPGLVLYSGTGDARGWLGYGRLQSWELEQQDGSPIGAIVSLSCSGSARLGSIHGLSEVALATGAAASALGAVGEVPSSDDEALGLTLAERIVGGASCLAQALTPPVPALQRFRISGDPLAPFIGARGSRAALAGIAAPGVGDPLSPVSWGGVFAID